MTSTLGALIRAARHASGLTVTELGIAIGRDASAISRWENDLQRPSGEAVHRLVEVLGLDPAVVHSLLAQVGMVERIPQSVVEAIRADPNLCPEAKAKMIGLYELLRQVPMPDPRKERHSWAA